LRDQLRLELRVLEELRLHFRHLADELHHRSLRQAACGRSRWAGLSRSRFRPALGRGLNQLKLGPGSEPYPQLESTDFDHVSVANLLPIDASPVNLDAVAPQKIDDPQPLGREHQAGVNPRDALVFEPDVALAAGPNERYRGRDARHLASAPAGL